MAGGEAKLKDPLFWERTWKERSRVNTRLNAILPIGHPEDFVIFIEVRFKPLKLWKNSYKTSLYATKAQRHKVL